LHFFASPHLTTPFFSAASALFCKNTWGGGSPSIQLLKFYLNPASDQDVRFLHPGRFFGTSPACPSWRKRALILSAVSRANSSGNFASPTACLSSDASCAISRHTSVVYTNFFPGVPGL
jgi:hypothetical protein